MVSVISSEFDLLLVPISGPEIAVVSLRAPDPVTIGRGSHHALCLNDRRVSRDHATLTWTADSGNNGRDSGSWWIADTQSRYGTWVNGERLTPGGRAPVRAGDRIVILPWTFSVAAAGEPALIEQTLGTIEDDPQTSVSRMDVDRVEVLAHDRLALLLRCADAIHGAATERDLASAIVDAAVTGTGFANAALLRAGLDLDQMTLIAHRGQVVSAGQPALSRSLLEQASRGTPARLQQLDDGSAGSLSSMRLGIREALCVPILLESNIAGYLYLDNRGADGSCSVEEAAGFAMGLSRLAALAWANLRRIDAERRGAKMEAELAAAGRMQRLLLPNQTGTYGAFSFRGESRPGKLVGGDFFDVISLSQNRLVIALGDVSGKGIEAAVLMTASQGFLHAALHEHGDAGRALTELNHYVFPRAPDGKFITLWIAVLDLRQKVMHAVDAGHGHAFLLTPKGSISPAAVNKSFPIGVDEETVYVSQSLPLPAEGRLLMLSDGLLEQCSAAPARNAGAQCRGEPFSIEGVQRCLRRLAPGVDEIDAIFAAVHAHGETDELTDDATAVLVRW